MKEDGARDQTEKLLIKYIKKVRDADLEDLLWLVKQYAFKGLADKTCKEE